MWWKLWDWACACEVWGGWGTELAMVQPEVVICGLDRKFYISPAHLVKVWQEQTRQGTSPDANLTAYNNKEVQHAKTLELLHYYRPSERIQIVYNFIKQAVWNRFVLFSSWSVVKVWSDSFIGRVIVQLTLCWPVTAERERVEAWNWPSEQGERLHGLKRARTWQPHILSA